MSLHFVMINFLRPDPSYSLFLKEVPGEWRSEEWPIQRTIWNRWYLDTNQTLQSTAGTFLQFR